MTLSEEKINGVITLEISGKIHAEAAEELLKKLNTLIDQGERHLLLDFSGVEYINSSGLRALLTAAKILNNLSGKMVLTDVNELVHQVLHVSGCASRIAVYPSKEEALKALNG
jgi:anti-sigma B factor antagonist